MTNNKTIFVPGRAGNQGGTAAKIFQNNNTYLGKSIRLVTKQLSTSEVSGKP